MTLQLGGGGEITGCTLLQEPVLIVSGITVNGDIAAPKMIVASGTEALPSYTFSGDVDTGLYTPAANTVAISTDGSERLRVDNSGNVGLGTKSPSGRLTIQDGGYRQGIVLERNGSTIDRGFIYIGDGTNSTITDEIYLDAYNTAFHFRQGATGTTETVTFTSAGNVGIGVSTIVGGGGDVSIIRNSALRWAESDGTQRADIYGDTNNNLVFRNGTGSTERMRIQSTGNVNIGRNGDHTDNTARLAVLNSGASESWSVRPGTNVANQIDLLSYNYGTSTYLPVRDTASEWSWFSGTGGERARIDSSGRLLVNCSTTGTQRNDAPVQIETGSSGNALNLRCRSSDDVFAYLNFTNNAQTNVAAEINVARSAVNNATDLNFGVAAAGVPTPTQRMKISTLGTTHFTNTGAYYGNNAPSFHSFDSNLAQWVLGIRNSGAEPYGLRLKYDTVKNNTTNQFIYASDASLKFGVNSNGGIENYSGNNTNLSDKREKKNIVSLDAKWDKVKNWTIRKFHYNEDAETDDLRYGVIAQEVEPENPEVVTTWTKQRAEDAVLDDEGKVVVPAQEEILRKGVKEQQMMWMGIKALQEAMARIEALESEVSKLRSN